ncbi:MAG TPA: ATP-dependent DNA helicase RecG [Gemmataceae bacterium]|nr:ATP-dependent DNA helicase RecG [Gemmataceae bacterium]
MPQPFLLAAADSPLLGNLQVLKAGTPTRREQLQRLGITTVADLLLHLPRTYEDLSAIRTIATLKAGEVQVVQGEVVEIDGRRLADGRSVVSIVINDGSPGSLEGSWFNQPFISGQFNYGQRVSFTGKPKWFRDHWQMANPKWEKLDAGAALPAPGIVPIYPMTEHLRPESLRTIMRQAVDRFAPQTVDIVPDRLLRERHFPSLHAAFRNVHFPASMEAARIARERFSYEEFLVLQAALALRRRDLRDQQNAPSLTCTPEIDARIRRLFPFALTVDQDQAIRDICFDLASKRPMQRLLQADVGAGKTAVAVYAMLVAIANKHQTALMAPTEVLARQHAHTLDRYLAKSRVRRALLTGALTAAERRKLLADLAEGNLDLVIGTQALVSEDVKFARLGLAVIDEQHKFGVHQRAKMRSSGNDPHYLVMTATPIPRTVALTVFGDLDCSTMHQLPPGRKPVRTRIVPKNQRQRLYQQLAEELKQGKQAYVVCPLVEESANLDLTAAQQHYEDLKASVFKDFRLGLLHGRMAESGKDEVMKQFREGKIDLLVTTMVIEVGVDVANATWMLIEHAERFGLSQLHQMRGRISRGEAAGNCILFANPTTDEARNRLRIFTRNNNGFTLAEEDAKLRGLGEFFGARQHGLGELRFGDILADRELLQKARRDAIALVADDAGLSKPENRLLRQMVIQRYGTTLDLATVG